MNTFSKALLTLVLPILALLTLSVAPALAQTSPTPEGTVIENIASASFTDANGNSYTDVADTVSVTVGFQGGLDLVAPADKQPAAGTDSLSLAFSITNDGNGSDTLSVSSIVVADTTVVENVRYLFDGTIYADTASLNAALANYELLPDSSVTIEVIYDAVAGSGGLDSDVTLGVTSTRTGGNADSDTVNVAPPLGGAVTVTDPTDASQLPSNGTEYTMTFDVTSTLSGTDTLALKAISSNANVTITKINGVSADSINSTFLYNETKTITVSYTVADVAAGSTADITLTGNAILAAVSGNNTGTVTVIRPALTLTKGVFTDAAATTAVSGDVFPGNTVYYKITITNGGTAAATSVSLTDNLPAEVSYVGLVVPGGSVAWTPSELGGVVSGTVASLPVGSSAIVIVEVTIN